MSSRVYCGHIPYECRERDVERFFKGYGRIRDILLKRGYCFVEFADPRDADDAVHDLNGRSMMGMRVVVEMAKGKPRSGGFSGDRRGGRDYRDDRRGGRGHTRSRSPRRSHSRSESPRNRRSRRSDSRSASPAKRSPSRSPIDDRRSASPAPRKDSRSPSPAERNGNGRASRSPSDRSASRSPRDD
ncbi:Serine-arginine protein 55, protein [Aphelenchoides besseyi]|nr:Serine-arginine protein 55, protein [Aphelenchoides besseyi]KAI6220476.1 Serine-arginine protein 55, protein [Aphelenchoides besseyi]